MILLREGVGVGTLLYIAVILAKLTLRCGFCRKLRNYMSEKWPDCPVIYCSPKMRTSLVNWPRVFTSIVFVFSVVLPLSSQQNLQIGPSLYSALHWRMIGPFRGGRVLAVSGVPDKPETFYFGAVGGGVWKTTDGGHVWQPIFDQQPIASIGALAVAPSNPEIIYIGAGEADMRSDISFGDGVYKSADGGQS